MVGMACAFEAGWVHDWSFRLGTERGYAEVVQYIKEYWVALCFVALAWRSRSPIYLVLAATFVYLFLDDAVEIHERGGIALEQTLALQPLLGLRAQDIGEVLVSATAGSILLAAGLVAYRFSDVRSQRTARLTAAAVLVLAFFGVGVDLLHQAFEETWLAFPMEVVEDGGELLVMSGIAAGAFAWLRREVSHSLTGPPASASTTPLGR